MGGTQSRNFREALRRKSGQVVFTDEKFCSVLYVRNGMESWIETEEIAEYFRRLPRPSWVSPR